MCIGPETPPTTSASQKTKARCYCERVTFIGVVWLYLKKLLQMRRL